MRSYALTSFSFFILLACMAVASADAGWHLAESKTSELGPRFVVQTQDGVAELKGTNQWSDGTVQERLPMNVWRGKRLRLTLLLRKEGEAQAFASARINQGDKVSLRALTQRDAQGSGVWRNTFVQDVPTDARDLVVGIGIKGNGAVRLEDIKLEAVSQQVPLTHWKMALPSDDSFWCCFNAFERTLTSYP